ncbi:hypothetical protein GBAR_LOCUS10290 [Geodia barretti]|uniref:Uncharacterized protein n=1 Tax=Geodia barretti TaxID=519541 RepID=A0AA35WK59_GEOBA|nr:hypothetical protein GBAR_LOCUS10290 [Geodia barretti]
MCTNFSVIPLNGAGQGTSSTQRSFLHNHEVSSGFCHQIMGRILLYSRYCLINIELPSKHHFFPPALRCCAFKNTLNSTTIVVLRDNVHQ